LLSFIGAGASAQSGTPEAIQLLVETIAKNRLRRPAQQNVSSRIDRCLEGGKNESQLPRAPGQKGFRKARRGEGTPDYDRKRRALAVTFGDPNASAELRKQLIDDRVDNGAFAQQAMAALLAAGDTKLRADPPATGGRRPPWRAAALRGSGRLRRGPTRRP